MSPDPPDARFLVYTRAHCGLCDEMLESLALLAAAQRHGVDVQDVDVDAESRRRYGHKVPVLLFGGELVCHGHLDVSEVDKALAYHRRPV